MMSTFTPNDIAYLQTQPLDRLALVDADGNPRVVPLTC